MCVPRLAVQSQPHGTLRAKWPGETQTLGTQPLGLLSPWSLQCVSPGGVCEECPPWTLCIVPLQVQLYVNSHVSKGVTGTPIWNPGCCSTHNDEQRCLKSQHSQVACVPTALRLVQMAAPSSWALVLMEPAEASARVAR